MPVRVFLVSGHLHILKHHKWKILLFLSVRGFGIICVKGQNIMLFWVGDRDSHYAQEKREQCLGKHEEVRQIFLFFFGVGGLRLFSKSPCCLQEWSYLPCGPCQLINQNHSFPTMVICKYLKNLSWSYLILLILCWIW